MPSHIIVARRGDIGAVMSAIQVLHTERGIPFSGMEVVCLGGSEVILPKLDPSVVCHPATSLKDALAHIKGKGTSCVSVVADRCDKDPVYKALDGAGIPANRITPNGKIVGCPQMGKRLSPPQHQPK